MKVSRTRFVLYFVVSAFVFQFISNSVLGSEMRMFPFNGDTYPGSDSPLFWKSMVAMLIFPIKFVLLSPLAFLFALPDVPPPFVLFPYVLYWAAIALVLHFIFSKIMALKQA